jgi:predicted O-linked N-acetylglucosamine transferase (SPINDLY family)
LTVEFLFQQFSQSLNAESLAPLAQAYPDHPYTLFAQAILAFRAGDWVSAEHGFTQAYLAQPTLWEALFYKARALEAQYHFVEAAQLYEQILTQQPCPMKVWQHLLALWQLLGEHERSQTVIASLVGPQGQAQWHDHPDYARWRMRLEALSLMLAFGSEHITGRQLWRQAQAWSQQYLAEASRLSSPPPPLRSSPAVQRYEAHGVLRIAYLSNEWTSAAVELGYTALFAHHARQPQLQIYGLGPKGASPPSKALAAHFQDFLFLDPDNPHASVSTFAGFDVVVDISGWFYVDAWLPLAMAKGPVKVMLASNPPFFAPGALFDAIVSDRHVLPRERQRELSSRFIEKPCFFHWQPGADLPQTLALTRQKTASKRISVLGQHSLRLGVVASRNKINPASLRLWAEVLKALPDTTQLTLKGLYYQDVHLQAQLRQAFLAVGGRTEQLAFEDNRLRGDLYSFLLEQDIILDTVPYSGALSTCDAYWSGTPIISLRSERGIAESIHFNTQSMELLADDATDFIARVLQLAEDSGARKAYTVSLPARMWASPICQWQNFGESMAHLYRQLWQQKIQKKN